MKKFILLLTFVLTLSGFSQNINPLKWSTSVEKINESEYYLVIHFDIEKDWHLYSQYNPEDASLPMVISTEDSNIQIVGKAIESKTEREYSETWEKEEIFFAKEGFVKQKVKLLDQKIDKVSLILEAQVCKEVCIQVYEEFDFDLKKNASVNTQLIDAESDNKKTSHNKTNTSTTNKGLLSIFFIAFLSGFAALLTPCVFPMIPLTVSFFTKQSKTRAVGIRKAIIYGVSIVVIYVLLGVLVSAIFGADSLNALSTNVWFNLLFFAILIVFAVSFLGAFDLVLPSSWGNKVDTLSDKGGSIGIFFMALALAIVSFSCTGPIVGTLLVEAAVGGNQIGPIIGMLGFSLAIALPFTLFAAFPGWLNSLPKSGGWLNTVKVVLGFLELALAFKFLSNADLVLQLHLLEREVFLAIWIAIFGALAFYLFGKIQLPHDSPQTHISVGRFSLGLLSLAFTIYLLPGMWGAPLNLISAFPPPQHYSESPYGVGFTKSLKGIENSYSSEVPEGAHILAPYNILAFNDYHLGLAYAKKVGKPVMIDFTGHACVNCRKMEQNVWAKPKVLDILKNEIVLISLYVDDKRKLPESEVVNSKLNPNRKIKSIGQKWSEFQTLRYKTNAQPFYVLINHQEENLIDPVAYTPNVDEYYNWLRKGIDSFKK